MGFDSNASLDRITEVVQMSGRAPCLPSDVVGMSENKCAVAVSAKDEEIAAVLTFVSNSFGNQSDPIQPAQVKKVRDANPNRQLLYNTEELLKEHPLTK